MRYKLRDICDLINDKISINELVNANLSSTYISTENMLPNKCGIVSPSAVPAVGKITVYKINDVLISNIRPYFKKIWFALNNGGCSNDVLVFRAKDNVLPDFLHYVLAADNFFDYAMKTSKGTKMPRGDKKAIMEYEVPKMDFTTQKKVSIILHQIDNKIALNTHINENLEQQAQAIFKSWFVDFEPFGGVMPDDWQIKPISELDVLVTDYVANGSFKSLAQNVEYQSEETDNVLIRLTDYNNSYSSDMVYITDSAYDFLAKSKLYGDEIIISNVGVNVGTVFRCPRLKKRMSLAPNSIMLRSELLGHYLYIHFTSQYGQQQLQSIVTGSAQPKFNKTNFRSLSVLLPESSVLKEFNAIYTPIYDMIATNFNENQRLSALRDTLLPKLMSGEIDVSKVNV